MSLASCDSLRSSPRAVPVADVFRTMKLLVCMVRFPGVPAQVFWPVVRSYAVVVAALHAVWARARVKRQHGPCDADYGLRAVAPVQVYAPITMGGYPRLHQSWVASTLAPPAPSPELTKLVVVIPTIKAWNRYPFDCLIHLPD